MRPFGSRTSRVKMPRQGGCARGERVKRSEDSNAATGTTAPAEPITDFAARAKAAWVRLIRKVYQAPIRSNARRVTARCR